LRYITEEQCAEKYKDVVSENEKLKEEISELRKKLEDILSLLK
jgi:hypothetical protein